MIAGLLLGLLADLVFDTAAGQRRGYEATVDQYLARRGFASARSASRRSR